MKNIKDIIPNITDEQIEQLRSVIVLYDGDIQPLDTVVAQWYSKEDVENNMSVEITDKDWNRFTKHDKYSYEIFGNCLQHMYDILDAVPHKSDDNVIICS